jgi:DNA-binding MarR family transcriptional regulator
MDEKKDSSKDQLLEWGGLEDILGLHIRLAHGAVYRHFTQAFSDLQLTQKQVSILWLIERNPGIAQTDVANYLQMDRATTMAIVNNLQARNFLVRGNSTADRRRQPLSLTKDGLAVLATARQAVAEHETWLKSRFSAREVTKLIELLSRIHASTKP